MNTVGIILTLISQRGITEQRFLSEMGFNRTLLSDWKSGKSKSYMKHLSEIAAYFGVSTDYLLGNSGTKNAPAAPEDSELLTLLEDPDIREALIKLRKLPPDRKKIAKDILNSLEAHQEPPEDR